ncbi:hypothetical protein DdX_07656 [Ditylenchus destructor]|uniref:Uncharacterized protein n=1 Tax=Ditylenchus destructor TaxID=166010 RepID=A0AAD4N8D0_9BILA|nr:hypothetical protein DdX_07656 [Ditylenchus destructor]
MADEFANIEVDGGSKSMATEDAQANTSLVQSTSGADRSSISANTRKGKQNKQTGMWNGVMMICSNDMRIFTHSVDVRICKGGIARQVKSMGRSTSLMSLFVRSMVVMSRC